MTTQALTREQFETIRATLEAARLKRRPRKHDLYDVFCVVLQYLKPGATWRTVPTGGIHWRVVHEYFTQWVEGDDPLLEQVLGRLGRKVEIDHLNALKGQAK